MFNWLYPSTGSYKGLVRNKRQAIMGTNADLIHWHIYAPLGGDELNMMICTGIAKKPKAKT